MGMKSRCVLVVLAMAPVFVFNSCGGSNKVTVNTSFVWVATQGDQMVRSYAISQNNGAINPIGSNGSPVATGAQPQAMLLPDQDPKVAQVHEASRVRADADELTERRPPDRACGRLKE